MDGSLLVTSMLVGTPIFGAVDRNDGISLGWIVCVGLVEGTRLGERESGFVEGNKLGERVGAIDGTSLGWIV